MRSATNHTHSEAFLIILKHKKMCGYVVREEYWSLKYVPDWFKTQEMCIKEVKEDLDFLIHVPDQFLATQEIRYKDYSRAAAPVLKSYDNRVIKWYQGYKKRKAQNTKVKEELLPIA